MPSIGQFSFVVWQGWLHPASRKVAMIDTDFAGDGNAVIRGGYGNEVHDLRTIAEFASVSLALATYNAYRAIEGTMVTCIDQFGTNWPSVVVMRVRAQPAAIGYNSRYRLEAMWKLLPATTRPT